MNIAYIYTLVLFCAIVTVLAICAIVILVFGTIRFLNHLLISQTREANEDIRYERILKEMRGKYE